MSFNRHLSVILLSLLSVMTLGQDKLRTSSTTSPTNGTSKIMIVDKSPSDGRIIKQGTRTSLACASNINWFFCVWKSPGGHKQCAIQQDSNPQNVCSADKRILLQGRGNRCEVELKSVSPEDHGKWACLLTDDEHLGTDIGTINIEVAVPAKVRFDPSFGETGILRLTEGDLTQIQCVATGGYPTPQVSWSEPEGADIDLTAEPEIITLTNDHTSNVYHTIRYRAHLRDNNTVITCVATQLDYNGVGLYESSAALVIQVDKIILPPIENAMTQKIGIISGVLLSAILLILVITFCVFIVCKRNSKRSKRPSSQTTYDSSPDSQITNIKPIWTTSKEIVSSSPFYHTKVYKEKETEYQNSNSHNFPMQNQNHESLADGHKTMSTQSITSQGSWEENRSVGGEIEDSSLQKIISINPRFGTKTPSLHETHFDGEADYPITVLHPPDSFISYHPGRGLQQRISTLTRPSSSMAGSAYLSPNYLGSQRPSSAQSGPSNMFDTLSIRPIYSLNEGHTTSVKSVFDCDLGCFENKDGGHHARCDGTVDSNPNASLNTTLSGQTL